MQHPTITKDEILLWFRKKRIEHPNKFWTYKEINAELGQGLLFNLKIPILWNQGYLERKIDVAPGRHYVGFKLAEHYLKVMEEWHTNGILKNR